MADPLGSHASVARVEVQWAGGDLIRAIDNALADIPQVTRLDPDHADELALWCLRSIADLAETRRPPEPGGPLVLDGLRRLDLARAVTVAESAAPAGQDNLHLAMAALTAAERARCTATTDQNPTVAGHPETPPARRVWCWESGWAGYQPGPGTAAQRGNRPEAADTLRAAHEAMTRLGAKPLVERIHFPRRPSPHPARRTRVPQRRSPDSALAWARWSHPPRTRGPRPDRHRPHLRRDRASPIHQ